MTSIGQSSAAASKEGSGGAVVEGSSSGAGSVETKQAPRSFETYHLAYLHAWPLIGQIGAAPPFPIKKLDFDAVRTLVALLIS